MVIYQWSEMEIAKVASHYLNGHVGKHPVQVDLNRFAVSKQAIPISACDRQEYVAVGSLRWVEKRVIAIHARD